jgi:hypothetical protein
MAHIDFSTRRGQIKLMFNPVLNIPAPILRLRRFFQPVVGTRNNCSGVGLNHSASEFRVWQVRTGFSMVYGWWFDAHLPSNFTLFSFSRQASIFCKLRQLTFSYILSAHAEIIDIFSILATSLLANLI